MQKKAKLFADSDPKLAEFNKVGGNTTKLSMNSIYGCLGLKDNQLRVTVSSSTKEAPKVSGVGGGTRHAPTANQITAVSRCVFGNISCAIQQALPNAKQVYGDTDSVFCNHNTPGDGGCESLRLRERDGRLVYTMDVLMKNKISKFLPLLINASTKGIKFDASREAGVPFMKIAHERLAFIALLFAKKTYHMIHLKEGSPGSDAILACDSTHESVDKLVSEVECPHEYKGYVVTHNPSLIFAAAANDDTLMEFLVKEGAADPESLKEWFTLSDKWLEVDAEALYSMYASTMIDAEKGNWINWRTSREIEKDSLEHEKVTQAVNAFTLYRKGMFVKKGLVSASKLMGLQSMIIRTLPERIFDRSEEYRSSVSFHVKNCASFESSPFMSMTLSRVNKYKVAEKQTLPNPMAMMLNNHLHPNDHIKPAEKFLTVSSASAWSISGKGEVPNGYFLGGAVKWEHEMMRGLVPGTVVKSLSVVPNTIKTVVEMVKKDEKNMGTVIDEVISSMITAASCTSGAAFRKRALCYNTGTLCSDTLVRALLNGKLKSSWADKGDDSSSDDDGYDDHRLKGDGEDCDVVAITSDIKKCAGGKFSIDSIRERMKRCMIYDNAIFNRGDSPETLNLKQLMVDKLWLDQRVYLQLKDIIEQATALKRLVTKRKVNGVSLSELDEMIAEVDIDIDAVAKICAERMVQHCKKCPVILPDNQNAPLFEKVLELFSGKVKCTGTCMNATCQSLDFVLLCTLALREINERRRKTPFNSVATTRDIDGIIKHAVECELVKIVFGRRFNNDLDAVVFLFDEAVAAMNKETIERKIRGMAACVTTGSVYNPDDSRFFGGLYDKSSMVDESLSRGGKTVELSFVTGVYHREAIELSIAKLCQYDCIRNILIK